ncbi:MAG TPA: hypothetical protein VHV08_06495 [Pirellulales bacterium]|nr:hypothetical protein [Pirellulales bacterium]
MYSISNSGESWPRVFGGGYFRGADSSNNLIPRDFCSVRLGFFSRVGAPAARSATALGAVAELSVEVAWPSTCSDPGAADSDAASDIKDSGGEGSTGLATAAGALTP